MPSLIKITTPHKLTKNQKEFNKLSAELDKRLKELERTKTKLEAGRNLAAQHLLPLQVEYAKLLRGFVLALEQWLEHPKLKKGELGILHKLIVTSGNDFLEYEPDDAEIALLVDRTNDLMADDDGITDDDDDLFADFNATYHGNGHRHSRKPSNQQAEVRIERENRQLEEELHLGKMAKKIYTDLAKKLHPDREQDLDAQLAKTELMKQVTAAYGDNNIMLLMQLHQAHMDEQQQLMFDQLADDQIKSYIKLMKKQCTDLQYQIGALKRRPEAQLFQYLMTGSDMLQEVKMQIEVERMSQRNAALRRNIETLGTDIKSFRRFLKEMNAALPDDED